MPRSQTSLVMLRLEANENRFWIFSWLLFIGLGVGILYYILAQPAEKPTVVTRDKDSAATRWD